MNPYDALEAALIRSAPTNDRQDGTLVDDLALLVRSELHLAPLPTKLGGRGWATDCSTITELFECLRMLGRANLSLGRVFEGHVNALKLIELYGSAWQLENVAAEVAAGAWLGVWGAEGAEPVTFENGALRGIKRFASGIGMIDMAVVPVGDADECQLYLTPCNDAKRGDASVWQVSGMRATRSGTYDFTEVETDALGQPGQYRREPWFEGGVWRYCAVHLGGAEALRDEAVAAVLKRGQQDAPKQAERIARMAMLCETAHLWVLEAATRVESLGGSDGHSVAAYALLAREQTELACLDIMALADRAMGTAGHAQGCRADRVRRDLGLFLRQADIDGKLERAARALLSVDGNAQRL